MLLHFVSVLHFAAITSFCGVTDAITNEILAYIVRKCTGVYVCFCTFCNSSFFPSLHPWDPLG